MPAGDMKHRAKRFNEGLKLGATLFNALAIASFAAAVVVPVSQKHYDFFANDNWILLAAGLALHMVSQAVLRAFRAEE